MNVVKIVIHTLMLLCKTPVLLVIFLTGRSRGARTFRRELLAAGMEPEQAEQLTRMYKNVLLPYLKELPIVRMKK